MNIVDISTIRWFTISTQIGGINRVGISTLEVFWKRWNTTLSVTKKTPKGGNENQGWDFRTTFEGGRTYSFFFTVADKFDVVLRGRLLGNHNDFHIVKFLVI